MTTLLLLEFRRIVIYDFACFARFGVKPENGFSTVREAAFFNMFRI
uniref:Uncharacterized protein n=1 Tax=Rhizophora mucronata TaxID=61149 RepID=A0A2P2QPL9_RHIMU